MKRGRDDYEENDDIRLAAQELGSILDRGIDVKLVALDRISQLIDPRDEIYASNIALVHADAAFYLVELLADTSSDAVAVRAARLVAALTDHSIPAKSKLHTLGRDANVSKVLLNPVQGAFVDAGAIEKLVSWLFSRMDSKIQAAQDALSNLTSFNMDAKVVYLKELVQMFSSGEYKTLEPLDTLLANMDCKTDEDVIDNLHQLTQPLIHILQRPRSEEYTQHALSLLATLCERSSRDIVDAFKTNKDIVFGIAQHVLLGFSIQMQDIAVRALWQVTQGDALRYFLKNPNHGSDGVDDDDGDDDSGDNGDGDGSLELAIVDALRSKLREFIQLSDELDKHWHLKDENTSLNDHKERDQIFAATAAVDSRATSMAQADADETLEICYAEEARLLLKSLNTRLVRKTSSRGRSMESDRGKDGCEEESLTHKRTSCCMIYGDCIKTSKNIRMAPTFLETTDQQNAGNEDGYSHAINKMSPAESESPVTVVTTDEDLHQKMIGVEKTRRMLHQKESQLLESNPSLADHSLAELNSLATRALNNEDPVTSIAFYRILFSRISRCNITHPELYVCHSNCAAACLKLELYEDAMEQAERCARTAQASLKRNAKGSSSYIKSFLRKGQALIGLGRHREASLTFEKGLELDPWNIDLRKGLESASKKIVEDLMHGKGQEHRAITFPEASQRITYHPYAAPLHRVRTEDMLPLCLLTPFQAENDVHIKDTYNYMTIQADIRMPTRHFEQLEDAYFNERLKTAIEAAVSRIEDDDDADCRVLFMGAGAGVHPALALKAGARHVTAVERWLYLAEACNKTLEDNGFERERYQVIYKRPCDLKIKEDVPICCNVIVSNIFDQGLLTSGMIPAIHHALAELATHNAIVVPSNATVYMQAVELRISDVCNFDMSSINLYRWNSLYSSGTSLNLDAIQPLSDPVAVWYFDFGAPPTKSDTKIIDVEFTADGRFNAVMYWYELNLFGDITLSTGLDAMRAVPGLRYLQPAVQYIAGELRVDAGTIMPLVVTHNTVCMRFDIETAEYVHLMKHDASFPRQHFAMLRDGSRLAAYDKAIHRAVKRKLEESGQAHVLDMGSGSGILSLMAARAGATSVVACDLHESLCDVARKAVAANAFADTVSVVCRDVAMLERGRDVRPLGVNIIVADMFDSGLFGDQFEYFLHVAKKKVASPDATLIPSKATLYCMGVQALSNQVQGIDVSAFNKYRWDAEYSTVHNLGGFPHKQLTKPCKVMDVSFEVIGHENGKKSELLKLESIDCGVLNAVVFWFDLHLDDEETLSGSCSTKNVEVQQSSEQTIGGGDGAAVEHDNTTNTDTTIDDDGCVYVSQSSSTPQQHYWGQALQYLDRSVQVEPNKKLSLIYRKEGSKLRFSLRHGIGEWVGRAPWKIEWGGGASVENPHHQRVLYCDLLVSDFLMRCRSGRFPPIEKDINMVLAHCGSLFLDPASLEEAGHRLVVLEKLHQNKEFSPGASLQALTKPPFFLE